MQNKGFTLIELIIIIAILGIITSMCLPKSRVNNHKIYSEARLLTSEIRTLRYKVMTQGGIHSILLSEKYYSVINNGEVVKNVKLDDNTYISENFDKELKFDPSGSPKRGGSITIKDKTNNKSHVITIVPYTGRILLKE